jgi:hypothetical protein
MTASQLFAFIATRTAYANVVPHGPLSQSQFNRKVANAFSANTGRTVHIGEIVFFPLAAPNSALSLQMPNVILCDGSEVAKISFPELAEYLGDTQGTAVDPLNFVLPDVRNFVFAPSVPVQVVDTGGTVTTGQDSSTPTEAGQSGGTSGSYPVSGGRPRVSGDFEV